MAHAGGPANYSRSRGPGPAVKLEITTFAAAVASGFLVDVENQMRGELGPEATEDSS
jgi:hypothetical protein